MTNAVLFAVHYTDVVAQSLPPCLVDSFMAFTENRLLQAQRLRLCGPARPGYRQPSHGRSVTSRRRAARQDPGIRPTDDAVVPPASEYQTVLLAPEPTPILSLLYHDPTRLTDLPSSLSQTTMQLTHSLRSSPPYWKVSSTPHIPIPYRTVPKRAHCPSEFFLTYLQSYQAI